MTIRIIGMKCTQTNQLKKVVSDALRELGVSATIEEISELNKMLKYPIFNSPALMVGDEVVCSGVVPGKDELKRLMTAAFGK